MKPTKQQIEKLLEIYKEIQEKETELSKFLDIMNKENNNSFDLLTDLFHKMLDNMVDSILDDEISYFIYDCELWEDPREIKTDWKTYKLDSVESFIDYLLKENLITN